MKNLIVVLFLLIGSMVNSQNKYDFSKIATGSELATLLLKMMQEHKEVSDSMLLEFIENSKEINGMMVPKRSGVNYSSKVSVTGMHYDGIPVATATFYNNSIKLITDTIAYSGKKLLNAIEGKNGLTIKYDNKNIFTWEKENKDLKLQIELVNGKNLAQLGDKDFATLKIDFKPVYNIPFTKIYKEIQTFKRQPDYVLVSSDNNCVYEIIINDVKVVETHMLYRLHLNTYITDKVTAVKIIAKPASDGKAYYAATILDETTDETIKEIEGGDLEGKTVVFEADFNSELPYYPKAWTNGVNLKKKKNIKEKVTALYDKLGKAILAKDEQVLNAMFYQQQYETQQLNYDIKFQTAIQKWELLLRLQRNLKYTISKNFDIEFSAQGKLIYTQPKDFDQMLLFNQERYRDDFNFYLYQPKGSKELKIIR